ncbi:MAG: NUDIX domain-containing protein, partial [Pseudomonadota bacterium]
YWDANAKLFQDAILSGKSVEEANALLRSRGVSEADRIRAQDAYLAQVGKGSAPDVTTPPSPVRDAETFIANLRRERIDQGFALNGEHIGKLLEIITRPDGLSNKLPTDLRQKAEDLVRKHINISLLRNQRKGIDGVPGELRQVARDFGLEAHLETQRKNLGIKGAPPPGDQKPDFKFPERALSIEELREKARGLEEKARNRPNDGFENELRSVLLAIDYLQKNPDKPVYRVTEADGSEVTFPSRRVGQIDKAIVVSRPDGRQVPVIFEEKGKGLDGPNFGTKENPKTEFEKQEARESSQLAKYTSTGKKAVFVLTGDEPEKSLGNIKKVFGRIEDQSSLDNARGLIYLMPRAEYEKFLSTGEMSEAFARFLDSDPLNRIPEVLPKLYAAENRRPESTTFQQAVDSLRYASRPESSPPPARGDPSDKSPVLDLLRPLALSETGPRTIATSPEAPKSQITNSPAPRSLSQKMGGIENQRAADNAYQELTGRKPTAEESVRLAAANKAASEKPPEYWGSSEQPYWRPGPNPTVDLIVTRDGANGPEVLLIKRGPKGAEPNKWAIPGGFHDSEAGKGEFWRPGKESAEDAALRELVEETGLDASVIRTRMKKVGTYDNHGRDPRDNEEAWAVTNAFQLHLDGDLRKASVKGMDDASKAEWVPVAELGKRALAFDHAAILRDAMPRTPTLVKVSGLDQDLSEFRIAGVKNTQISHAAERAVERGISPDKQTARSALEQLSREIKAQGFPKGTIADPKRADSVLVPFGKGWVSFELKKNGSVHMRTTVDKPFENPAADPTSPRGPPDQGPLPKTQEERFEVTSKAVRENLPGASADLIQKIQKLVEEKGHNNRSGVVKHYEATDQQLRARTQDLRAGLKALKVDPEVAKKITTAVLRGGAAGEAAEAPKQTITLQGQGYIDVYEDGVVIFRTGEMSDQFKSLRQAVPKYKGWLTVIAGSNIFEKQIKPKDWSPAIPESKTSVSHAQLTEAIKQFGIDLTKYQGIILISPYGGSEENGFSQAKAMAEQFGLPVVAADGTIDPKTLLVRHPQNTGTTVDARFRVLNPFFEPWVVVTPQNRVPSAGSNGPNPDTILRELNSNQLKKLEEGQIEGQKKAVGQDKFEDFYLISERMEQLQYGVFLDKFCPDFWDDSIKSRLTKAIDPYGMKSRE